MLPDNLPLWLKALLSIALLVPIGVYLLIVANIGTHVASWAVRILRPLLLMLLLAPGVSVGHGIAVLPMGMMLLAGGNPPNQMAFNLIVWLVYSAAGFLGELWVARRRARRHANARRHAEQHDRSAALRELTGGDGRRDSPSA